MSFGERRAARERLLHTFMAVTLILLAAAIAGSWWKLAILNYDSPIDEVRLVVKPTAGHVVVTIPFPDGLTERQAANLHRANPDAYYLDFDYVAEHTLATFGESSGAVERCAKTTGQRKPKAPPAGR